LKQPNIGYLTVEALHYGVSSCSLLALLASSYVY